MNHLNLDKNANLYSVHKSEPVPGTSLTCIITDKFKSGCITLNLLCGLKRDTASINALLPRVLRRGSANLPDIECITAALDDLYGVRIEPIVRKKGEIHSIGFYADFPDDRYIPDGESVAENAVDILCDILLSPCTENDLLKAEYVESEKSNLIDDISAVINDKRGYAIERLIEEMCADEAYGVSKLGDEDAVKAITPQSLTAHYHDVIKNSRIEILYCGSIAPEKINDIFKIALAELPERNYTEIPKTEIVYSPGPQAPYKYTEHLDITQCKLVVGFRLGNSMKKPDIPAFMLLNAVYGGSVSSKLFLNVRERLSLCYYAGSMMDKHKGIMLVSSGVEYLKADVALNEILKQLDNVKNGDISELEFTSAKNSVITSVRSALDRAGGLEELYFDSVVSSVTYNPADLAEIIDEVTVQRVINAASCIKPDSIYILSGFEKNESEAADVEA